MTPRTLTTALGLAFALAGCPQAGDDDDTTFEPVTEPTPDEGVFVEGVHPEDGSDGHHVGTVAWADFADIPEGTFDLVDGSGASVPHTVFAAGELRRVIEPDAPLAAGETYTASYADGLGETAWTFSTTADAPASLDAPLADEGFVLRLNQGTLVGPPGGEAFVNQLETDMLVTFPTAPPTPVVRAALALANSDPPVQDMCLPTGDWSPVEWDDPRFQTEAMTVRQGFELPAAGWVDVPFEDWSIGGWIAADKQSIPWADVRLTLDMRRTGLNVSCEKAALFLAGLSCLPCPSEPEVNECFVIWYSGVPGERVEGLTLDVVTEQQVDEDPGCDRAPEE